MDSNNKNNRAESDNVHTGADNKRVSGERTTLSMDVKLFSAVVLLVAIGIVFYVALNHINSIWGVLRTAFQIIRPLFIGAILALVLNAPMAALNRFFIWLGKKMLSRSKYKVNERATEIIALIMTFVLAILILYVVGDSVIPQLVESIKAVVVSIQNNMPNLIAALNKLEEIGINTEPIAEKLNSIDISKFIENIVNNWRNIVSTIMTSASTIIGALVRSISAVVFAIYILANKKTLSRQGKKVAYAYFKRSFVDKAIETCSLTSKTVSHFISGQCLDAVILGLMMFFTMTIFKFPFALAISALITVTAIIPYVGAFLGGAFGVLLMILDTPVKALLFVILFIVVQQIDNHLVYPKVVGSSVGLPAIWTFAAVIVGGSLWGVIGMVLFIPLFSVIYTLISKNVGERLERRGIAVSDSSDTTYDSEAEEKNNRDKPQRTLRSELERMLSRFMRGNKNDSDDVDEDNKDDKNN